MTERRGPDRCDSEGSFCALHDHLEGERKEYREMVCSKIAAKADKDLNASEHHEMQQGIAATMTCITDIHKAYLPRWVFILFLATAITILGAGFGFFGSNISETNKLILKTNESVQHMSGQMSVVLWRIEKLEDKVTAFERGQ